MTHDQTNAGAAPSFTGTECGAQNVSDFFVSPLFILCWERNRGFGAREIGGTRGTRLGAFPHENRGVFREHMNTGPRRQR